MVEVLDQPARFRLVEVDAVGLPQLVATDSVWWNGVREYHEIWIESGLLLLTGTSTPRYDVDVRYVEYNVVRSGGTTTRTPRIQSREHDFGLVQYDSRGDLVMWSEYYSPLVHTAIPSGDSVRVSYRIPGDDIYLDLLFRRNQSSPNRALEART